MKNSRPKVLVSPLNWGLGHATRCIPVIRELIEQDVYVFISASGEGKIILENEFPSLTFLNIPGISIQYPKQGSMALSMLSQMPSILNAIRKEHLVLKSIIDEYQITHVISDNRYGLFSSKVKTAFITHQVRIKSSGGTKFLEPVLNYINKLFICRFNELWIPDQPPPGNLSGELSDTTSVKITTKYLGILSRFNFPAKPNEKKYDIIALLSGPEPQRTLLEEKLTPYLHSTGKNCLLVQGLPSKKTVTVKNKVETISAISSSHFESILHNETLLISRPGYSTIMDIAALQHQNLLFIPTPGQTEQEYLANYLYHMFGIRYVMQHEHLPDPQSVAPGNLTFGVMPSELKNTVHKFLLKN